MGVKDSFDVPDQVEKMKAGMILDDADKGMRRSSN